MTKKKSYIGRIGQSGTHGQDGDSGNDGANGNKGYTGLCAIYRMGYRFQELLEVINNS